MFTTDTFIILYTVYVLTSQQVLSLFEIDKLVISQVHDSKFKYAFRRLVTLVCHSSNLQAPKEGTRNTLK